MPRVKLFDETEVLEKAMRLFWKNGYHATSMQELVSTLGINRASLYDTYGGKKELFDRSLCLYKETNGEWITNFFEEHSSVKEGFFKLFEHSINQSIEDTDRKGCFVVNTASELIPGDEELRQAVIENQNTFEEAFYQYLFKGVESGEIDSSKDLKSMATLLFTMHNGIRIVTKANTDKEKMLASVRLTLSILD